MNDGDDEQSDGGLTGRNVLLAGVDLIKPERIDAAYTRVVSKNVRYRFVIDIAAPRHA